MKIRHANIKSRFWLSAGLSLTTTLCGCLPLTQKCGDGEYGGLNKHIQTAVKANATVHVLMVHGMGDNCPGAWDGFMQCFTNELSLHQTAKTERQYLPSPLPGVSNELRQFHYGAGRTNFILYELTWTPTTLPYKSRAFAKDRTLAPGRVWVNALLKSNLMDEGFGDALLYLNPEFRPMMQLPILQSIDIVSAAATNKHDQIVLLTHSLGSAMTFDTVVTHQSSAQYGDSIKRFTEKTTDIIMFANQIPLLNLALATDITNNSSIAGQDSPVKAFIRLTKGNKHERWKDEPGLSDEDKTNLLTIHLVAATDPNDLLSWPLTTNDVMSVPDQMAGDGAKVDVANIYMHNASAILGVFEWPLSAHDNYKTNRRLIRQVLRGFKPSKHCFATPVAENFTCPCEQPSP